MTPRTPAAPVAALVLLGAVACGGASSAPDAGGTWAPDAAQLAAANATALQEARGTVPGPDGAPLPLAQVSASGGSWPSNVSRVEYVGTTREQAGPLVGTDFSQDDTADENAIVMRLTGSFSVLTTGPQGAAPFRSGEVMTVVIDPVTGDVTDFGIGAAADAAPLDGDVVTEYVSG